MHLGTPDDDTVFPPFHHPDESVGIGELGRPFTPVHLGIGHAAVHDPVPLLYQEHVLFKPLMIIGAVFFIHFIGGGKNRIEGIHPHASLKAGAAFLAQKPLHAHLFIEVFGALV